MSASMFSSANVKSGPSVGKRRIPRQSTGGSPGCPSTAPGMARLVAVVRWFDRTPREVTRSLLRPRKVVAEGDYVALIMVGVYDNDTYDCKGDVAAAVKAFNKEV